MIVLDTNVLSETLRPLPDSRVMTWLAAQPRTALFATVVIQVEILYGLGVLPDGTRRRTLSAAVDAIFAEDFAGRLLAFDSDAANAYARIAVTRKSAGRPISQFDAMIAACARSRGATLATRNTKDFWGCEISLIDPWAVS